MELLIPLLGLIIPFIGGVGAGLCRIYRGKNSTGIAIALGVISAMAIKNFLFTQVPNSFMMFVIGAIWMIVCGMAYTFGHYLGLDN